MRVRSNEELARSPAKGPDQSTTLVGPEAGTRPQDEDQPQADDSGPSPPRDRSPHVPERTCILTRKQGTRDSLIRLALGPDGQVGPDVRARAPGRGAWIGVTQTALQAAQAKGKLKGALSRAFKTGALVIPDDLPERTEAALRRTLLDRLGLEARSGTLLTGSDKIEEAARRGRVGMLLHAADAGADGNRRLDQAWRVGSDEEGGARRGLVIPLGRAILSVALGRENVVHLALTDSAAAGRVTHALDRWLGFIGPDCEPGPGGYDAGDSSLNAEERGAATTNEGF